VTPLDQRRRLIVGIFMAVLAVVALRDAARLGNALPWRTMDDFPDFYCAGAVLNQRASPYNYEPLRTCEHRVNVGNTYRAKLFASNPGVAVPAPLPPYDFVPFMVLARLPFADARLIDALAIVVAVSLCVVALAGLEVPIDVAAAALVLSTGFVELNTGQIVPFALLALVSCGFFLARGPHWLAGIAATLTAIEPTVGVPVVAATLLFVPRARSAVVVTGFVVALTAFAMVGVHELTKYLTSVLPAQAGSELRFPFEYSLAYALAFLGASPEVARFAGAFSYLVLLAIGLWFAPRTSRALGRPELLVFLPAFCAVIAGPYIHAEELCFALPALLTMAIATQGRVRAACAIAVCVLSIPWILVWGMKQLFVASIFVSAVVLVRLRINALTASAGLVAIAALLYLLELRPPHLPVPEHALQRVYAPSDLVQAEWRDYTQQRATHDALWFDIKIPTWAALLGGLAIAACYSLLWPIRCQPVGSKAPDA
jgi:hypothetical protein